ncbi:MAG TPA: ribonuclease HII [Gammaproteobacteria bacterium]|nr:ribonuclease HII [Gammaproteobacteria bacterium]MEC8012016.1 ribonuclease HII [Pseudomonadota bacterium]HBF09825.1 ribonuclease HII [Gammaproteobacteria bacterium]HCK92436.1 ribonuclease HII [Gammaproteobacteria bacterium]|tara:strand:+ start:399 stop:989 length:591 start_codon:yes stop_codon:yes gene_type:complete
MANQIVAGVDEVGRGPLAGAVVAAAVILDPNNPIQGLADSKKLSEKKREALFVEIQEKALAVGVGRAEPAEIDELNILQASLVAMVRAVNSLEVTPTHVLVDGNQVIQVEQPCEAVVGGDHLIQEISAASIIAKVLRDREMMELALEYPEYGFDKHKGYPTKVHMAALEEHGALEIHRKSFRPVQNALKRAALERS